MARNQRIDYDGAYHHVMARGNRGEDIFHQDVDRQDFLEYMERVCQRHGWRVLAYCLMNNHYHLAIFTPNAGLSDGMKDLNSYYTRRYNWRYQTYGHVFQGRFKSIIIEHDDYLLEVLRYIMMNPVAAGLAKSPSAWKWSSYHDLTSNRPAPSEHSLLDRDRVHNLLGSNRAEAIRRLKNFVTARSQAAIASRKRLQELIELSPTERRKLLHRRMKDDSIAGMTQQDIATKWQVGQSTVHRAIKSVN